MKLWRHTRKDAFLALFSPLQLLATCAWALHYDGWGPAANASAFAALALAFYFNPIVVTHNFLHCPFFRSDALNRAFAVFNSANLFLPQVLYRHHHLIHHQFSNDRVSGGTTRDPSSTFRYGRDGRHESPLAYCALSLFRDGTTHAFRRAVKKGESVQLLMETAAVLAAAALWLAISPRWFLTAYLPLFYAGWFLAHLENYYEHRHAPAPGTRFGNAVSYYGRIYNRVMFNEGYHQEHHVQPQRHWTERPLTRAQYRAELDAAGIRPARFPPLASWLERGSA